MTNKKTEILEFRMVCPECGGNQISICAPDPGMPWPTHWPEEGVLGAADCRSCQQEFLVALPTELKPLISACIWRSGNRLLANVYVIDQIVAALFNVKE